MLAKQAEQKMFRADVIVIEVPRFFDRVFDHLFRPRGLRQLAHGDHVGPALDEFFNFKANLAKVDVEILQNIRANAAPFLHQPEQNVLGADIFVVEALGFLIGKGHDFSGPIRETFKHVHLLVGRQG